MFFYFIMELIEQLSPEWRKFLHKAFEEPSILPLQKFIDSEYQTQRVFPPREMLFSAFRMISPDQVRVVILGQDPYHEAGQAHGLAFSVQKGVRLPPSLRNIYKELHDDLGIEPSHDGYLGKWAEQGILMLNTVLTVRAHAPGSHRKKGWEEFTDGVIRQLNEHSPHLIFVLWGAPAQTKLSLIDQTRHTVICSAHPSPLSAHRGFFGSKPFSKINADLVKHGYMPIRWDLRDTLSQPELF